MNRVQEMINDADMILIGVGDEMTEKKSSKEEIREAYNRLNELVNRKLWFLITLNTDDLVTESDLSSFFIATPCGSEKAGNIVTDPDFDETPYVEQWQYYTNFLTATLGKKLLILELGVGLSYPGVIRMPFEKTILMNRKAKMVRVHSKLAFAPEEIEDRCVCITQLPADFLINFNKNN